MCNLYAVTLPREAMRQVFRAGSDRTGNHKALSAVFADQMAPVVRRLADGTRQIQTMRWGFACPPGFATRPVTNVRNTASAYWRPWLKPEFRCLVPVNSFCEYSDQAPKTPHWFALGPDRPVCAFAGIWRPWRGVRRGAAGDHLLFAFLTTEANAEMRPIHAKAMPVILTGAACDTWLEAPEHEALALQRPLPDGTLQIVARGAKADPVGAADRDARPDLLF